MIKDKNDDENPKIDAGTALAIKFWEWCNTFMWQVNVLALLDHPNIIRYFDSFEEDGVLMIEMEYADGGYINSFHVSSIHSGSFYNSY